MFISCSHTDSQYYTRARTRNKHNILIDKQKEEISSRQKLVKKEAV